MKPLTMSEEQEAEDREALVSNNWWALGSGAHQNIADRAWDEVDALRAMVGKLEQEYDIYQRTLRDLHALCGHEGAPTTHGLDYTTVLGARLRKHGETTLALAASQAEVRELREALAMTWPGISGYSAPQSPLGALGGDIQRTHRAATAALSRPPGDDTALREMLVEALGRALNEAWKHDMPINKEALESIINRILGQPGDDAKEAT